MLKRTIIIFLLVFLSLTNVTYAQTQFKYDRWPVGDFNKESIIKDYGNGHFGLDIQADEGTPVYAPVSGNIYWTYSGGNHGISVGIEHANGTRMTFLHLSERSVKKGQAVESGQEIGRVGMTGSGRDSEPAHLHFAVIVNANAPVTKPQERYANPLDFLPAALATEEQIPADTSPVPSGQPVAEPANTNPAPASQITKEPVQNQQPVQPTAEGSPDPSPASDQVNSQADVPVEIAPASSQSGQKAKELKTTNQILSPTGQAPVPANKTNVFKIDKKTNDVLNSPIAGLKMLKSVKKDNKPDYIKDSTSEHLEKPAFNLNRIILPAIKISLLILFFLIELLYYLRNRDLNNQKPTQNFITKPVPV